MMRMERRIMKTALLVAAAVVLALPAYAQSTLYSNSTTGYVGIGTTAPGGPLDVESPGTVFLNSGLVQIAPTLTNTGTAALFSEPTMVQTGTTYSGNFTALRSQATIGAANTQNFANTGLGLGGVWGRTMITSGASGTITNVAGVFSQVLNNSSAATITNAYGVDVHTIANSGTMTGAAGVAVTGITAATNNTELLLGTLSIPSGNYGIYDSSGYQNYLAGNVGIGTTAPANPLSVNGVIQSLTGGFQFPDGTTQTTAASAAGSDIKSVKEQVFTSSGTYTPSAGMAYCSVRLIGGGGGGGGASANYTGAGGGGSGGVAEGMFSAATIGTSQVVTVGAALAAARAITTVVLAEQASLGSLLTGNGGGSGGGTASGFTSSSGGWGGTASGGNVQYNGANGLAGFGYNVSPFLAVGGNGANGLFGGGGAGALLSSGLPVAAGSSYGAGGGGAAAATSDVAGAAGAAGVVIITEYCTQ